MTDLRDWCQHNLRTLMGMDTPEALRWLKEETGIVTDRDTLGRAFMAALFANPQVPKRVQAAEMRRRRAEASEYEVETERLRGAKAGAKLRRMRRPANRGRVEAA